MTDIGKTVLTFDREYLIMRIASAMRASGRTCDADSWSEVMAQEAVDCLYRMGALK